MNIVAVGSYYGAECRSLFISDCNTGSDPYVLDTGKVDKKTRKPIRVLIPSNRDIFIGADAAGLEIRVLTHYLIEICSELLREATEASNAQGMLRYSEALKSAYIYRETLLEGDIHDHNKELAGLSSRGHAKTFFYSFLYGIGDEKLGISLGGGKKEGVDAKEKFLRECPCIPVLIDWCKDHASKYGWLPGLDGRKLIMRKDENGIPQTHKALNTLLQAGGSIVVKKATLILDNRKKEVKLDAHQVIHMH